MKIFMMSSISKRILDNNIYKNTFHVRKALANIDGMFSKLFPSFKRSFNRRSLFPKLS